MFSRECYLCPDGFVIGQRLLQFNDPSLISLGSRRGVVQDVIDNPKILFGVLGVICEFFGDINLQIVPRGAESSPLDRFHSGIADARDTGGSA